MRRLRPDTGLARLELARDRGAHDGPGDRGDAGPRHCSLRPGAGTISVELDELASDCEELAAPGARSDRRAGGAALRSGGSRPMDTSDSDAEFPRSGWGGAWNVCRRFRLRDLAWNSKHAVRERHIGPGAARYRTRPDCAAISQ